MIKLKLFVIIASLFVFSMEAQNQLPIENGSFEQASGNTFTQWTNQANNGGSANFSVETNNLIPGSIKAIKSEIVALGTNSFNVSTKSDYGFQIVAGEQYTVSFYAKTESAQSGLIKIIFQSEVSAGFLNQEITITNNWKL